MNSAKSMALFLCAPMPSASQVDRAAGSESPILASSYVDQRALEHSPPLTLCGTRPVKRAALASSALLSPDALDGVGFEGVLACARAHGQS